MSETLNLKVDGMTCGHCAKAVTGAIQALDSEARVQVDLAAGTGLGGDAAGLRCLDLFAGTGALGFEAASRGAAFVLLNEWQRSAHAQLQKSAALLKSRQGGEDLQLDIRQQDGLALLKNWQGEAFDLLFLDPPFAQEASYATALRAAQGKAASVYLEASRQWSDAELNALGWQAAKHSRAGAVHGHLLRPGVQGAA